MFPPFFKYIFPLHQPNLSWKTCALKNFILDTNTMSRLREKQRVSQNSGDALNRWCLLLRMFYDGNLVWQNGMTQYTVWHQVWWYVWQAGVAQWYGTIHRVEVWQAGMACVLLLKAAFLIRPCLKLPIWGRVGERSFECNFLHNLSNLRQQTT